MPHDDEQLLAWRLERFLAAGVNVDAACDLAASAADYHEAERLAAVGCPPDLLARIVAA